MSETRFVRDRELLEAGLDDDLVALDVDAGQAYGFNAVAAAIWRSLESPRTFDELMKMIGEEFDTSAADCEGQSRRFVERLERLGLIRRLM